MIFHRVIITFSSLTCELHDIFPNSSIKSVKEANKQGNDTQRGEGEARGTGGGGGASPFRMLMSQDLNSQATSVTTMKLLVFNWQRMEHATPIPHGCY